MSNQELKPCPFCRQNLEWCTDLCGFVHPVESFCVASGLLVEKADADRWNTRTPDPMLEELAGALDRLLNFTAGEWLKTMDDAEVALKKYQQSKVQP